MQNGEWIDTLCSTGDGAFIVDDNSQIIRWNKPAESILQYSEPEVLNQKCYQIFSGKTSAGTIHCRPDCKVRCNVEKASQENFDIETRTKDGKVLWLNVSVISPVIAGKRYIAHILRDISKEKKMVSVVNRLLEDLGVQNRSRNFSPTGSPTGASIPDDNLQAPRGAAEILSERELQVLLLLAEGLSTKDLAQKLHISHFTARNHIQNILVKLGLHSKAQAVSYTFREGLLSNRIED
jgi:PAS domain S-box-containing protein